VQNDQMMIPSVTRVFSKSRKLDVFLQAYRQAAGVTQPLIAYVSLQDEQKKIFASQPVELLPEAGSRLGTTPIRFSIPLAALPAGKFDCQVTILDPTTQKGTFWQAPVMIVP
jgi:hypothetical protein